MDDLPRIIITINDSQSGLQMPFPRHLAEEIQAATRIDNVIDVNSRHKAHVESRFLKSISSEMIVALGTAGVFIAIVQIVDRFIKKNANREISFQCGDKRIIIKGHSLKEAKDIFIELFSTIEQNKLMEADLYIDKENVKSK